MKLAVTLPTFSADAGAVLAAARAAEEAGLHGVFSFDHVFPMGQPERPSLSLYPVLGAVAAVTKEISVGPLVARIGLVPDEVVVASLESLHLLLGERLIAALGTGDKASEEEHLRYGIPYLGVKAREESMAGVVRRLAAGGVECWVGAGSARSTTRPTLTARVAEEVGATVNYWQVPPEAVAEAVATLSVPVTWGGPLPKTVTEAAAALATVQAAGASWAIWGWPSSLELVVEAARLAGVELRHGP